MATPRNGRQRGEHMESPPKLGVLAHLAFHLSTCRCMVLRLFCYPYVTQEPPSYSATVTEALMPRQTLTARYVDAVKPPASSRAEHWDASTPGFGLRVSASGRKS